jgi:catechol 2,3-dioxygenase-like lactoylglutathione lyase family enzyme
MSMAPAGREPQRLRIQGIHHITLICSSLERSMSFYRDTLGLRVVKRTRNADDPNAFHFFFGDAVGTPGTVITCMEYPEMEEARVGRGGTHHFALTVDSPEEVEGWRQYLQSRGIGCTEVLDRTYFKSIYLRDPDGHIMEIASAGPGFTVDEDAEHLGERIVE